jgi:hypothetical protein
MEFLEEGAAVGKVMVVVVVVALEFNRLSVSSDQAE